MRSNPGEAGCGLRRHAGDVHEGGGAGLLEGRQRQGASLAKGCRVILKGSTLI